MNYFYLTREEISDLSDEDFPRKMGVFKKKKADSLTAWRITLLKLIDDGDIKLRVRKEKVSKDKTAELLLVLGDEAINVFRDQQMLGPLDGQEAAYKAASPDESSRVANALRLWPEREEQPSVDCLRLSFEMFTWVGDTLDLKQEEAEYCNLDCMLCPRHKLLACAASNRSPAADDGHIIRLEER